MARVETSIILGRFSFLSLMILQCVFLASYPSKYEEKSGWYAVIILFIPAVLLWWWISYRTDVYYVFIFWTVYIWLGLVPLIGIVFDRISDKIQSKGFWNPSTLKITLCITPFLLLLIFHTSIASTEFNFRQVTECSLKATINLCDGIELLGVILDENECSHGIPKPYKNAVIAFGCIGYLWFSIVMAVDFYCSGTSDEDHGNELWLVYYVIQWVFETIFLGLRLGLSTRYGITVSIFIGKNMLMIVVHIRQTCSFFCGSENATSTNQQRHDENEATIPIPREQEITAPQPRQARLVNVHPVRSLSVDPAPSAPPPFNPEVPIN